jgi:lactoylglutathione lyase
MASQSPTFEFTHTRLLVDEYAACFRFYRDAFGFEPTFGDESSGYADFDTDGTTLALFDADEMVAGTGDRDDPDDGTPALDRGASFRDAVALVFGVESVDEAVASLRDHTEIVTEPSDRPEWGIRVAHVRDPDGTLIEVNEPLE